MMPPTPEISSAAAADSVELPPQTLEQLRVAGRWARFVAIVTFVVVGLAGMASVALLVAQSDRGTPLPGVVGMLVGVAVALVVGAGAASLAWRYGQDAVAFSAHGAPALARAFRSLRHLVVLWTLAVGLGAAWNVIRVLAKFF
jgi:hypothetical protein